MTEDDVDHRETDAPIEGVCFDLDNTLVDRDAALASWTCKLAVHASGHPQPIQALAALLDDVRRADQRGYTPRAQACAGIAAALAARGWTRDGLDDGARVWERMRATLGAHAPHRQGVIDTLHRLRARGLRLAIVSNGGGPNQRSKMTHAGLAGRIPESRVLISQEVGIDKPAPGIYALALERLGLPAERVLFVGDHPEHDVRTPQRLGMRACWISNGTPWPGTREEPHAPWRRVARIAAIERALWPPPPSPAPTVRAPHE